MINHLKLCRLCGSLLNDNDDDDTEEGTKKARTCYDMLKNLLNVEVLHNEKLPNKVCDNCFHQLDSFIMFKENFFRTQSSFELVLEQKCFNILSTTGINASQNNEGELDLEMTVTDETKNLPVDDQNCKATSSQESADCQIVARIEPTNQNSGSTFQDQSTASQIVARIEPTNQNSVSFANQYGGLCQTEVVGPCTLCKESQTNKTTANLTQKESDRGTRTKFIVEMIPIEPHPEELNTVIVDDSDNEQDPFQQVVCVQDPLRLSPTIKTEPITGHPEFDMQLALPQIKVEFDEAPFSRGQQTHGASFTRGLLTHNYYVDERIPRIKQEVIEDSPGTSNEVPLLLHNQATEPVTTSSSNARRTGWREERTFNCSASTSGVMRIPQPVRKFSRQTHSRLQPLPGCRPSSEGQFTTLKLNEELRKIMEESKNLKVAMTRIPLSWPLEEIGRRRTNGEFNKEKENELATISGSFGINRRRKREIEIETQKKHEIHSARMKAFRSDPKNRMERAAKIREAKIRKKLERERQETETPCEIDHSSRMKAYWSDPRNRMEHLAKMQEARIRKKLERESQQTVVADVTGSCPSEEREQEKGGQSALTCDEERKTSFWFNGEELSEKRRAKLSAKIKAWWSHADRRLQHSAKLNDFYRRKSNLYNGKNPEHSAKMKAYWRDPIKRMEQSAKIREACRRRKLEQDARERQQGETDKTEKNCGTLYKYWNIEKSNNNRADKTQRKEELTRERVERLGAYWKRRREEKAASRVETTAVNELKSAENEKIDETCQSPSDNTTQLATVNDSLSNNGFIGFDDSSDSKTDSASVLNDSNFNLVEPTFN
ncbi:hypothetical protein LSTR_LSTR010521 [Laodelphax striatellus]|uniref:ZAD domain-containing protein n=1 Tax=Laodelphax striatellus TaxID=195883 RepID=A0A482X2C5_LAOST|nr:hypothetical protein LSTR_LSTR010521 [Laodelphax striatellus]